MTVVCRLDEIPDGGARGFRLPDGRGGELRIIVVRRGDWAHAFHNRCPHRGTPLDWGPDQFLDREGRHLVCATHGAIFRKEDGVCVAGPCAGDELDPVAVVVEEAEVRVVEPDLQSG